MRIFEKSEVEDILSRLEKTPEYKITAILDELENEHPGVYRVIYGEPSDAIASINNDMANLYLDLSFDVVWVFREAFGKPPEVINEERWVLSELSLLDAELKSLAIVEAPMSDNFGRNLQECFVKKSFASEMQLELLQYLGNEVTKYVSFDIKRAPARQLTTNLLFVFVRLLGDLYGLKAAKSE